MLARWLTKATGRCGSASGSTHTFTSPVSLASPRATDPYSPMRTARCVAGGSVRPKRGAGRYAGPGGWGGRPVAMAERGGNAREATAHNCLCDRGRGLKSQTAAGAATQALNSGGHPSGSCVTWANAVTKPEPNQVSISVRLSPTPCRHWIPPEHVDATAIGSQKSRRHRLWPSEPARNRYTYKSMDSIFRQSGPCSFS
jgi:hypothetical protein